MFGLDSIKWIAIGIGVVVIGIAGYRLYTIVQENGQYKIQLEQLQTLVKEKEDVITKMTEDVKIREQILEQRDQQVQQLENSLNGATKDLGPDADQQAPESIREFLNRLNQMEQLQ